MRWDAIAYSIIYISTGINNKDKYVLEYANNNFQSRNIEYNKLTYYRKYQNTVRDITVG